MSPKLPHPMAAQVLRPPVVVAAVEDCEVEAVVMLDSPRVVDAVVVTGTSHTAA